MRDERSCVPVAVSGGSGFLIGVLLSFESGRSTFRFGPNPLGSILPPSDRERRLGRRSRSFSASDPQLPHATIEAMTPTSRTPLRLRALAALAVLAVAIAACQPASPSVTSSPSAAATPTRSAPPASASAPAASPSAAASPADLSATYAKIEGDVRAIRGLQAKKPVDPVVLDDAGIKKVTADGFRKDNPQALVDANERLLKGLGLLPADANLGDLYVKLLGEQVAGLYSPDDKALYVVSHTGKLGPTEKTTFAHEYTHALQDQNFDLSSLKLDEVGEGDRGIARLSLVEGDATLVMTYWQIQHLSQTELLQLLGESLNPEVSGSLTAMPKILQESLLFPYTAGLGFVQMLQAAGGWDAVNNAFTSPPASTEQVMHPEKYGVHELPVDVELPSDLASKMGSGWSKGLEDTLGEFQLKVWLDQVKAAAGVPSADKAAAGWGGDRVMLLDGPSGARAIALKTAWDTPADAAEFVQAAEPVVAKIGNGKVSPGADGTVTVILGSSSQVTDQLAAALGG